jgi:hypothetical protein
VSGGQPRANAARGRRPVRRHCRIRNDPIRVQRFMQTLLVICAVSLVVFVMNYYGATRST